MNLTRRNFFAGSLAGLAVLGAAPEQADAAQRSLTQFDPQIKPLLAQMTLDEKIGQMSQPDQQYLKTLDDIENYHLGSVLSGGDSDPKTGNDLTSWTDMYDRYQSRALKTRLRIPLLYGVDAVHGHNNVIGATVFPHNIGLGCTRDAKLVESSRAHHRGRGEGDGDQLGLLSLRHRSAGHPLGPDLRGIQREPGRGEAPRRGRDARSAR